MSIKKLFYILPKNLAILCSIVIFLCSKLNLGQGETFQIKIKKLAVVVHVLQTTHNLVISRCCFAEDGKEMYTKNYNARAHLLFCSLNLLFSDVPVAVAVVVFLRPIYTMRL